MFHNTINKLGWMAILILMVFTTSVQPVYAWRGMPQNSPKTVEDEIPGSGKTIYLPMVNRASDDPSGFQLLTPAQGALLSTLIPEFSWKGKELSSDYGVCMALETKPDPTDCWIFYSGDTNVDLMSFIFYENLQPDTVYYWRVGYYLEDDFDNKTWSNQRWFRTGKNGVIPQTPVLSSPVNGSTITSEDLTLTWQPVSDVLGYMTRIEGIDYNRGMEEESSTDATLIVPFFSDMVPSYGNHYAWAVKSRNAYAWSEWTPDWTFNYYPNQSAQRAESKSRPEITRWIKINGEKFGIIEASVP